VHLRILKPAFASGGPSLVISNTFSREPMRPALVIHGQVVRSYNDGSFYIERRSARRPNDWVSQDSYPRASLEVYPTSPLCCCVGLTMCFSANARDIPERNLFKPRNSVKYLPLDSIDMSTTSGGKRIEKYLLGGYFLLIESGLFNRPAS
jgi:hypothetical protein